MTQEERFRLSVFGRDFGEVFWEYLTEEFPRIKGVIRRSVFVVITPILLFIGWWGAIHAHCYMLFVGRVY